MEKINKKFKKVFEQIQIKISRIFAFKARKGLGPLAILLILGVGGIIGVGWALTGKMLGGVEWIAAQVIIGISKILVWMLGGLISFLVQTIVNVAQWNKFTTAPAVQTAWGILRDLANMFFILGFLVIAFATVLKSEKYSAKSMLLPLLMMALLVNFSLMICGLVIDFAQVIMLSFVNAFKDIGGGNLIQMLGIGDLLKLEGGIPEGQAGQVGTLEQAGIYALAALIAFISVVVLAIVAIILILRIVTLWILIILSPLAFIFYVIPGGRSYADMWQKKFVSQVIVGPVLAFFLWFAFYTVQVANEETAKHPEVMEKLKIGEGIFAVTLRPEFYGGFILGCAMLIGALLAAQQIGAVGASLAGKGVNFLQRSGTKATKAIAKAGLKPIKYGAGVAKEWAMTKLEESKLSFLTPTFWKGIQERFKERREQSTLRATGRGYAFFDERFRLRGRKEAAELAKRRYEQRIIELQMRKEYEAWGALGYGEAQLANIAKSALLTRGKEGDIRRQTLLQMISKTGNIDDVYEFAVKNGWHKDPNMFRKLTDEERKRMETMDSLGFEIFQRGFLGISNKFSPEGLKMFNKEAVSKYLEKNGEEIKTEAKSKVEEEIKVKTETAKKEIKEIDEKLRKLPGQKEIEIKAVIKAKMEEIEKSGEKIITLPGEKPEEALQRVAEERAKEEIGGIHKKYKEIEKSLKERRGKLEEEIKDLSSEEKQKEMIGERVLDIAASRIAAKNTEKASWDEQQKMRTLYAVTQNILRTGHFPQGRVNIDPNTGKYYFMTNREAFDYMNSNFMKIKGRELLGITTPFIFNIKKYNPKTGKMEWFASPETKSLENILYIENYPRDVFSNLDYWAPRNAAILLGVEGWVEDPIFDKEGRVKPGKQEKLEELVKLNPQFFAHAYRLQFFGKPTGEPKEAPEIATSDRPWELWENHLKTKKRLDKKS